MLTVERRSTEAALTEARVAALGRAMEPSDEEMELARQFRRTYGHDMARVMEQVWRLDVYRARRVLVAMLDQLSDEEHDSLHRQFGDGQ